MYVIINEKGYYYRNMGAHETKGTCWTRKIERAAKYDSKEHAENNLCPENERAVNICDLLY